jgi:hypothetical protein
VQHSHYVTSTEANAVLQRLVPGVQAILGDQLVGMYLFGSLAVGDFDPTRSDIDFVAVTEIELTAAQLQRLQAFHAQLFASGLPLADQIEGAYLSRAALRIYDPSNAYHPHIDRGEAALTIKRLECDWVVQRYSLREHGIVLLGPPIRPLIDPISSETLGRAVRDILDSWWAVMLDDPARLRQDAYQVYAVATFCRMLYTLEEGGLISKPAACQWAMRHLDRRFVPLIERAIADQLNQADIPATQAFLRYTLDRSREFKVSSGEEPPRADDGSKSA